MTLPHSNEELCRHVSGDLPNLVRDEASKSIPLVTPWLASLMLLQAFASVSVCALKGVLELVQNIQASMTQP